MGTSPKTMKANTAGGVVIPRPSMIPSFCCFSSVANVDSPSLQHILDFTEGIVLTPDAVTQKKARLRRNEMKLDLGCVKVN